MSKKDKKSKKEQKKPKKGLSRIFVDSENVGNFIPEDLPDDMEVWFFLSDVNVYRKVYPLLDKPNFHVVDVLQSDNERKREKNEMDFAIIAFVSNMIQSGLKKKDKYIVLSYDKGYDRAIELLRNENPKLNLERVECSLRQFIDDVPDPRKGSVFKGTLPRSAVIRDIAVRCCDWDTFRKGLSASQKKSLRLNSAKNDESGAVAWFEYDFYNDKYRLYSSGTFAGEYDSLEAGQADYDKVLSKGKKKLPKKRQWRRRKRHEKPNLQA